MEGNSHKNKGNTKMTPEEYNKWAATEVMGWHEGKSGYNKYNYYDKGGNFKYTKKGWNPWNNIEQAYQCEEALNYTDRRAYVKILAESKNITNGFGEIDIGNLFSFKHASPDEIIQAIYQAKEGE